MDRLAVSHRAILKQKILRLTLQVPRPTIGIFAPLLSVTAGIILVALK